MEKTDWTKFPGVPITFKVEETFDADYHVKWYYENWTLTLYVSILYLVAVYVGTKYMKDQVPFKLQIPLTLWSLSLSVFSIMAAIRLAPVSIHLIRTKGKFYESF